jgi:hypothetical protein
MLQELNSIDYDDVVNVYSFYVKQPSNEIILHGSKYEMPSRTKQIVIEFNVDKVENVL